MIVFPDQSVAGRQAAPILTIAMVVLLLLLAAADRFWLDLGDGSGTAALGAAALLLLMTGGPMEFALGRMVYCLAVVFCGLATFGLSLMSGPTLIDGLQWISVSAAAISGVAGGLFRSWRLRPFYLFSGIIGQVRLPAYLPAIVWLLAHGALLAVDRISARELLLVVQSTSAGLLIGVAMSALSLIRPGIFTADYVGRVVRRGLQEAYDLIRQHRLRPARSLIRRLSHLDPESIEVRRAAYAAWKYHPAKQEFHDSAAALLDRSGTDAETNQAVYELYRDYMAVTQGKPQLNPELHLRLAKRFARNQEVDDAANIVNVYLQRNIEQRQLPDAVLTLAEGYVLTDRPGKASHYAETLVALYPDSREADAAQEMLDRLSRLTP